MSGGVRRFAVAFAITILLLPCANLLAATIPNTSRQILTAQIVTAVNSESAKTGVHNKPNKVAITPQARANAADILNTPTQIVTADNSGSAKAGVHNKPNITPQARANAAEIFESRCVACHGAEGHGDGPAAANLNPRPRDFHNAKWQKSITDVTIARAIVFGGQAVGVSAQMAANPDLENEPAVVAALVEHVRVLGK
jgi:mono/diheme cytochrome c family protein